MESEFVSALLKWGAGVLVLAAVLCIGLAAAILFFPGVFGKILLYVLAVGLLLVGVGVVIGLVCALLRGGERKNGEKAR